MHPFTNDLIACRSALADFLDYVGRWCLNLKIRPQELLLTLGCVG